MTDELREAIEWARIESDFGNGRLEYQDRLALLADAAEHPEITPEAIAALLPDTINETPVAGIVFRPRAERWVVCSEEPRLAAGALCWSFECPPKDLLLNFPAPLDWTKSWIAKPQAEVRCPHCKSIVDFDYEMSQAEMDLKLWAWYCTKCGAKGPDYDNEVDARESDRRK